MCRHPPLELVVEVLRSYGLVVSETVIDESRTIPAELFTRILLQKGYSTLHLLSTREYDEGCAKVKEEVPSSGTYYYDYQMTLIVARGLR